MRIVTVAVLVAASINTSPTSVEASTFTGFSETSQYFNSGATFDYDPIFFGGTILDPNGLVDILLAPDLSSGFLTLLDGTSFATDLAGTLIETDLSTDGGIAEDTFSMLFSLSTGAASHAIAVFTGDLDGSGSSNFLTDGVFFENGQLEIIGASQDEAAVIPLPAGAILLLSGLASMGGLACVRRRQA